MPCKPEELSRVIRTYVKAGCVGDSAATGRARCGDVHGSSQCRGGGDRWLLGAFLPARLTGEIQVKEALSQKTRSSGGNALLLDVTLRSANTEKVNWCLPRNFTLID